MTFLICFFGVFRPTQEFFTYMETSRLPVKGCILDSWSLNSRGSLVCYTSVVLWHGTSVYTGHLRGPVTHTYCCAFGSGAVTTCFNDLGLSRLEFEHPTFRLRGERSNRRGNLDRKRKFGQKKKLKSNLIMFPIILQLCRGIDQVINSWFIIGVPYTQTAVIRSANVGIFWQCCWSYVDKWRRLDIILLIGPTLLPTVG